MSLVQHGLVRGGMLVAALATACTFASAAEAAPPAGCHQLDGTVTCQYDPVGAEQQLTVPAGVTSVRVSATGATGGAGPDGRTSPSPGGAGGVAAADLPVAPGEVLYVEVGGAGGQGTAGAGGVGGYDGGGTGGSYQGGGGGGGASAVRTVACGSGCPGSTASLQSRLLVAAGGGGGAGNVVFFPVTTRGGGAGGGEVGTAGAEGFLAQLPTGGAFGGGGGGPAGGGPGGGPRCGDGTMNGIAGSDGALGVGGAGASGAPTFPGGPIANGDGVAGGGGGGGGLYGGGGGGSALPVANCGAGAGGGGSSFLTLQASNGSGSTATPGAPGAVKITYAAPAGSSSTYYVGPGGSGTACGVNSAAHPFARIQDALACAGDGDIVRIAPSATPYPGIGSVGANVTIAGATARGVRIDASQPDASGGTLMVPAGAAVDLENVTLDCVSHQCTRADVTNHGRLTLRGDTITGAGHAVAILDESTGSTPTQLSLLGSTIAHNTNADGVDDSQGGGLEELGPTSTVTVVNTTIADNTSGTGGGGGQGGGMLVSGDSSQVRLTNVTIADNHANGTFGGGGIYVPVGSTATVIASNTLIAQNTAAGGGPDCQGAIVDGPGGHNLVGDPTGCGALTDGVSGDQIGVAGPGVSAPADNGGPTDTAALDQQSLALGAGDPATCQSADVADTDQRDLPRGSAARGGCDIGAFDTDGLKPPPAHIWFVAPHGSGTACSANSVAQPFARVQDALVCASDGDAVRLAPSGSTPYPGIGGVDKNVTIEAAGGSDAGTVRVDLSQPDNDHGTLSVASNASVIVAGVTLDCVSHVCTTADITNRGTLALHAVTVTGAGRAVAVFNLADTLVATRLTVLNSAIFRNTNADGADGSQGGGIETVGTIDLRAKVRVTIANSTIAGNSSGAASGGQGGGMLLGAPGRVELTNVTIAQNASAGLFGGGGIYVPAGAIPDTVVVAANMLLAGNHALHAGADCQGSIADAPGGHNLIGDGSGCTGPVDGQHGDQVGVAQADVAVIGDYGGPTPTTALQSVSPAIGAGDPDTCVSAEIDDADQRGVARNAAARGACDIGAYDTGGPGSPTPTPTPTPIPTPTPTPPPLTAASTTAPTPTSPPASPFGGATDRTAPSILLPAPKDGAHYDQWQVVKAGFSCRDDGGSGIETCHGGVPVGGWIDTRTTGRHRFTVTAIDKAGNQASKTLHYDVVHDRGRLRPWADLAVSGRLSPRRPGVGDRVSYALTARNRGPGTATGVVLSTRVPAQVGRVSVRRPPGSECVWHGAQLVCRIAALPAGRSVRIVVVGSAVHHGQSEAHVRVSAREADPHPGDNTATLVTRVVSRR